MAMETLVHFFLKVFALLQTSILAKNMILSCDFSTQIHPFFLGISKKIASAGYGVFAMDYPGFGLSEGLHGYIPSFDLLVDDVIECFSRIKGRLCFSKDFYSSLC